MKGNEAIGEAAIRAGCIHFFGYPITPQSEVPEYLSRRLPEVGGVYLQAESEVAASNMICGAAGVGMKVLTTSSSPGISLMTEGISYIVGNELPVVIVNIMRAGPGLGGILPAQSDYTQATKALGHGDVRVVVLAPASVQEAVDTTMAAFDIAERYRLPVMIIGDGMIGQMMEPVEFPSEGVGKPLKANDWALTGCKGRKKRVITSLRLNPKMANDLNEKIDAKFKKVAENEERYEKYYCDEPNDLLIVAFGMMARICKTAVNELRAEGLKVGLFRPVLVSPYPYETLGKVIEQSKRVLTIEMNLGQMVHDVKLASNGRREVDFFGKTGGIIPAVEAVMEQAKESLSRIRGDG